MKATPENDFAVVRDRERHMVVGCGTYTQCVDDAAAMNHVYQSTAYVAEKWIWS